MGKLSGIKVVDLSQFLPGPMMTMMMADQGAEVIKVEPAAGDPARDQAPFEAGQSVWFRNLNRGKDCRRLDLKTDSGCNALWTLIESADVFVEGFRPGVMKRLGFDYDAVAARNPRIVYCSISAFGQTGALDVEVAQRGIFGQHPPQHRLGDVGQHFNTRRIACMAANRAAHAGPGRDLRDVERRQTADAALRHVRADILHRPGGRDPAAVEHHHALGQGFGLFQIMRGQQHAGAACDQCADGRPHPLARVDVQTGGRFVKEQHLRIAADRQRELHPPLLAAGQPAVAAIQHIVQTGQRDAVGHTARRGVIAAGEVKQFRDSGVVGDSRRLQHHPDPPTYGQGLRRLAEQLGAARIGFQQPQQQRDGGTLAGPVGAHGRAGGGGQ